MLKLLQMKLCIGFCRIEGVVILNYPPEYSHQQAIDRWDELGALKVTAQVTSLEELTVPEYNEFASHSRKY